MKIGIDIDDVLLDFCIPFVEFHNQRYGTDWGEVNSYRLEDFSGDSWDEMQTKMDRFVEEFDIFNKPIDSKIRESVERLSLEHELYIITGRANHYLDGTRKWAENNLKGLYRELCFVYGGENKTDKWEFCKRHGIETMIEDMEEFATKCNDNGIKVLLFDHTWNQGVEGSNITRVYGWQDIEKILCPKIKKKSRTEC